MHKLLTIPALALALVAIPAHAQETIHPSPLPDWGAVIATLEQAGDCAGAALLRMHHLGYGNAAPLQRACQNARLERTKAQMAEAAAHSPETATTFRRVLENGAKLYASDAELRRLEAIIASADD